MYGFYNTTKKPVRNETFWVSLYFNFLKSKSKHVHKHTFTLCKFWILFCKTVTWINKQTQLDFFVKKTNSSHITSLTRSSACVITFTLSFNLSVFILYTWRKCLCRHWNDFFCKAKSKNASTETTRYLHWNACTEKYARTVYAVIGMFCGKAYAWVKTGQGLYQWKMWKRKLGLIWKETKKIQKYVVVCVQYTYVGLCMGIFDRNPP